MGIKASQSSMQVYIQHTQAEDKTDHYYIFCMVQVNVTVSLVRKTVELIKVIHELNLYIYIYIGMEEQQQKLKLLSVIAGGDI